jgi:hypothetical protein
MGKEEKGDRGRWGKGKKGIGEYGERVRRGLQNEETLRGSEKIFSQERRSRLQGMCTAVCKAAGMYRKEYTVGTWRVG